MSEQTAHKRLFLNDILAGFGFVVDGIVRHLPFIQVGCCNRQAEWRVTQELRPTELDVPWQVDSFLVELLNLTTKIFDDQRQRHVGFGVEDVYAHCLWVSGVCGCKVRCFCEIFGGEGGFFEI